MVLLLDELPILVSALLFGPEHQMTDQRRERARIFLSWLREATITHRGRISFVVSGSIGLEPLLSRAGISETMTTFTPLELGPWETVTALKYIEDRSKRQGILFQAGAADLLIEKLGYLIPHPVAMFTRFVCIDAARQCKTECSVEDIARVYNQHMLSVHGHVDLATYEDRLKRVVGADILRPALELLTEAATVGNLTPKAGLLILRSHGFEQADAVDSLRFLLGLFEHDGYLKRDGSNNYRFVSHLLCDWWRNRFGFGYTPAQQKSDECQ